MKKPSINKQVIMPNVLRWRSEKGKPLAHVRDHRKTKHNPNEHKFGNIGLLIEKRIKP